MRMIVAMFVLLGALVATSPAEAQSAPCNPSTQTCL